MPEVRLVGPNGEQVGIVRVEDALRLAEEADLDLVEVAPDYDHSGMTAILAAQILLNTIGRIAHNRR